MRAISSLPKYSLVSALTLTLALGLPARADDALQAPQVMRQSQASEILLNLSINGRNTKNVVIFLQDKQGNYYIQQADVARYDLHLPVAPPVNYEGTLYYPISALSDEKAEVDLRNLSVNITVAAQRFKSSSVTIDTREFVTPTMPDLGGFLNYDVFGQEFDGATSVNTFLAPGIFYGPGSATSGFIVSYNNGENTDFEDDDDSNSQVVRLNSTVEFDFPVKMTSLYLGDSFNAPGIWGNSIDFGGIQYGTNFGTQPTFLTFPTLQLSGEATVPSAVDLYMNNGLISKENVPAGPFTLNEIPVVSGSGMLKMVTTDLLGRQQIVEVPYYASTTMLKPGLHDYSFSAGFIRENYGSESNDYGQFMTVWNDQFGVTEMFTAEWRIEALLDQQTLGGGMVFLVEEAATVTIGAAGSHSDQFGEGGLLEFGFTRQDQYGLNFGFNLTGTSSKFVQIGFGEDTVAPSFQGQFFAGTQVFDFGTLAASYVFQNNRSPSDRNSETQNFQSQNAENLLSEKQGFLTVTYSQPLFKVWSMSITGFSALQGETNNSIFVTFSRMFDTYTGLNLAGGAQTESDAQGSAQLNRALPLGPGFGYNLYASATSGAGENYEANLNAQSDFGTYSVGAARFSNEMAYEAEIRGSLAVIDNDVYLARTLGGSFGVVEVPGLADIQVYNYNQVVATTGKDGKAFMPNLLPYQHNKIAIEPNDLPIGTELRNAEMDMVPYFQSGLMVRFPIESYYSATARLVDAHKKPLPAGTIIQAMGRDGDMMVADKGETYLNKLQPGLNQFEARYNGKTCYFSIDYAANSADQIPELGTLVCRKKS